jgi:hypothetical protein
MIYVPGQLLELDAWYPDRHLLVPAWPRTLFKRGLVVRDVSKAG